MIAGALETFYKAMRKDLGLSNAGIQRGDFLCLILKIGEAWDLIDARVTDPNITLEEIGRRSKTSQPGDPETGGNPLGNERTP